MSEFITVSGGENVEITLRPDVGPADFEEVSPELHAAITAESLQQASAIQVTVEESTEKSATVVGYLISIRKRIEALGVSASVVYSYSASIREKLQETNVISMFPEGS